MFHEKLDNLDRKMDFHLTNSACTFPCFQINWYGQETIFSQGHFLVLPGFKESKTSSKIERV